MMNTYHQLATTSRFDILRGGGRPQLIYILIILSILLPHSVVFAQLPSAPSLPECYTTALPPDAPGAAARGQLVVSGSNCRQYYPEYAPLAYDQQGLPEIPIKTVRIMFHVFQKNDGSDNWQSPTQDGGTDEAILRGLVYGIAYYPTSSSPTGRAARGLNGIYGGLDNRVTSATPNPAATPAPNPLGDARIRFQLEGIRYYRAPGGYHHALEVDGRAVGHHNLMVQ